MRQRSTKGSASGFRKISQGRLRQRVQVSAKYTEPGLEDMEEGQSASVNDDDSCDWDEDWTLGTRIPGRRSMLMLVIKTRMFQISTRLKKERKFLLGVESEM